MTELAPASAEMVGTPSTTQPESSTTSSEAPGYFDTIPDSHVFFPPKYPQSFKPSTAKAKVESKGIYSHDPILDQNPNELWRFLVSNLQKPHPAVHLFGTHTESRTRIVSNTANTITPSSSTLTHTETYTVTVTDFSFRIDISKYVIPQWTRIVAHPSHEASKAGQGTAMSTVRETLEEYTSSNNPFKEFRLKKVLVWDCERVTQSLKDLVRSTGYRTHVGVEFPTRDYKVVALASNEFSRAAHSKLVQVLCVVSCLCIVFWPAWAMARKCMKDRLDCEYQMAVSADEFYARNFARIQSAVVQRRRSEEFMDPL